MSVHHVWNSDRKRVTLLYRCSIVIIYESKELQLEVPWWEQGSWKRFCDESDSCLSKGMGGRNCESPHGVEFWCCTATAWWSEPWRCWLCPVFEDEHWLGKEECSQVTLSRQCMYWPCQQGYLFGELVTYTPAKWEVSGSNRPAGAVSHCHNGTQSGTTRGQYINVCTCVE